MNGLITGRTAKLPGLEDQTEPQTLPIVFTIHGEPKPQGSKVAQVIYGRDGKPVFKNGRVLAVVRDDSKQLRAWRQDVATTAAEAIVKAGIVEPLLGPVSLSIVFTRARPAGHFGTGRNARALKASAPKHPTTRPDTVKLTRAVEDALTGIVWRDDSQVCHHVLVKAWGQDFRTVVTIERL